MTITLICIQKGIANLNQALIHNGALLDAGCWMLDAPLFQPFGIVPSAAPITPHNIKAGGKKKKAKNLSWFETIHIP